METQVNTFILILAKHGLTDKTMFEDRPEDEQDNLWILLEELERFFGVD
jgi:hypothetical protein